LLSFNRALRQNALTPCLSTNIKQAQYLLRLRAEKQGLKEFTNELGSWVSEQQIESGLLVLFIRHTSASLLIQENVSPDVMRDLESFLAALVPEDENLYKHNEEGPDDM
tara:strand:- start:817 stop:1143 length:327 start_codon:yes stop_codon:yes gene_type:complete